MAISFDEINRVTLRIVLVPRYREFRESIGAPLPLDWNPSDEELERIAMAYAQAWREVYGACEEEG